MPQRGMIDQIIVLVAYVQRETHMSNLLAQVAVKEIEQYAQSFVELLESISDEQLWSTKGNLPNSIGTLALHLTGNLNHYFGTALLKTSYERHRDNEFSERGVSKAQVIADLKAAVEVAKKSVSAVTDDKIGQPYTSPDGQTYESLGFYVVHMAAHFAMHYGQADYARHFLK